MFGQILHRIRHNTYDNIICIGDTDSFNADTYFNPKEFTNFRVNNVVFYTRSAMVYRYGYITWVPRLPYNNVRNIPISYNRDWLKWEVAKDVESAK